MTASSGLLDTRRSLASAIGRKVRLRPSTMHGTYIRHAHTELNSRRHGHLVTALGRYVASSLAAKMYMSVICLVNRVREFGV